MQTDELLFIANTSFNYEEGIPLFDQRIASASATETPLQFSFKATPSGLLIKLKSDAISAKKMVYKQDIKLLEFTKYPERILFTLYTEEPEETTIVFKLQKETSLQLETFLESHQYEFVKNIKITDSELIQERQKSNLRGNSMTLLVIIGIIFLVYVLFKIITSVDFEGVASSGVFRILIYACIFIAIIVGALTRLGR